MLDCQENRTEPAANQIHHTTVEVMSLRMKLRDDIRIRLQSFGANTCYLIEDPCTSNYFRVGLPEYTFLSMLDGKTTVAEAMAKTAGITGSQALGERDVLELARWLIDSQFAETSDSRSANRLSETATTNQQQKRRERTNPIFQKIPLFNPDQCLNRLLPVARLLYCPLAVGIWVATVIIAGFAIATRWSEFWGSSSMIVDSHNWLWLAVCWMCLKLVHETSHAFACKKYGGRVREAGAMFILLMPLPYVDVTSIWRVDSRWKRILVSAAGMYAELFVAAIAAIVWSRWEPGLVKQNAQNVIFTASLMTIIFNANPLMRFDGYYMLSDLIGIPNLATQGNRFLRYLGRKYIFGLTTAPPPCPDGKKWWVMGYGIAAFAWRIVISLSLLLAAEAMFYGAGVLLASLALVLWVVVPVGRMLKTGMAGSETSPPNRRWFSSAITLTLAALVLLGWAVPFYSRTDVPVVFDFDPVRELRTDVGGMITDVHVQSGQQVQANQLLVTFQNRDLEFEAQRLRIEIQQTRQRAWEYRQNIEIAAFEIEQANATTLQQRLRDIELQLSHQQLRADQDGLVLSNDVDALIGSYRAPGSLVLKMGSPASRQFQCLIPQHDVAAIRSRVGETVNIRLHGRGDPIEGTVRRIQPRATVSVVHPALTSVGGGPLAVRVRDDSASDQSEQPYELIEPHFQADVTFESRQGPPLLAGETGMIRLYEYRGQLATVVIDSIRRWINRRPSTRASG